jgi:hypothetical protein
MTGEPDSWPLHLTPTDIIKTFKNLRVYKVRDVRDKYEIRSDTQEKLSKYVLTKKLGGTNTLHK